MNTQRDQQYGFAATAEARDAADQAERLEKKCEAVLKQHIIYTPVQFAERFLLAR